jgi:hypothetical protein
MPEALFVASKSRRRRTREYHSILALPAKIDAQYWARYARIAGAFLSRRRLLHPPSGFNFLRSRDRVSRTISDTRVTGLGAGLASVNECWARAPLLFFVNDSGCTDIE